MADYGKQWQEYKSLRNQVLAVPGLILVVLLLGLLFRRLISNSLHLEIAAIIVGAVLFATLFVVALRVEKWRCPRCGRRYVSRWVGSMAVFFAQNCVNCGLAKFANDSGQAS
jgi:predicted RNA-binding Zn-ribbon protein involved in translation (DUF1610 family)